MRLETQALVAAGRKPKPWLRTKLRFVPQTRMTAGRGLKGPDERPPGALDPASHRPRCPASIFILTGASTVIDGMTCREHFSASLLYWLANRPTRPENVMPLGQIPSLCAADESRFVPASFCFLLFPICSALLILKGLAAWPRRSSAFLSETCVRNLCRAGVPASDGPPCPPLKDETAPSGPKTPVRARRLETVMGESENFVKQSRKPHLCDSTE